MKQKLGLAAALVHRPGVLLDEPTTGVDPVTRQDFWQLIIRLAGASRSGPRRERRSAVAGRGHPGCTPTWTKRLAAGGWDSSARDVCWSKALPRNCAPVWTAVFSSCAAGPCPCCAMSPVPKVWKTPKCLGTGCICASGLESCRKSFLSLKAAFLRLAGDLFDAGGAGRARGRLYCLAGG